VIGRDTPTSPEFGGEKYKPTYERPTAYKTTLQSISGYMRSSYMAPCHITGRIAIASVHEPDWRIARSSHGIHSDREELNYADSGCTDGCPSGARKRSPPASIPPSWPAPSSSRRCRPHHRRCHSYHRGRVSPALTSVERTGDSRQRMFVEGCFRSWHAPLAVRSCSCSLVFF